MTMRKTSHALLAVALVVALAGCSNLNTQEQRALTGGAIGAAGGLAIGAIAGAPLLGGLVGAGTGAAAGAFTSADQVSLD